MSAPDPPDGNDPGTPPPPPPPPGWGTPPPQPPGPSDPQVPYPQQSGGQYGQPWGGQYGGQPSYPQPGGSGGFPAGPTTNQKAQWALAVGLLSVPGACCSALLGFVGIVGIVLGIQARREIAASGGQQTGDGLAMTGIVTGAIGTVLAVVFGIVLVMLVVGGELLTM